MTTALSFWILVVGGEPIEELRRFYERTFQIQFDRRSPFSLWDWGHHAQGLPDLRWLQRLLQAALVAAALALAFVPRRKSPSQLAAGRCVSRCSGASGRPRARARRSSPGHPPRSADQFRAKAV